MKQITRLRLDRGWSKAELARRAQVHPSQIGLFESGRLLPYPSQLVKLAAALEVDETIDLMAEIPTPPSQIAQ